MIILLFLLFSLSVLLAWLGYRRIAIGIFLIVFVIALFSYFPRAIAFIHQFLIF